MNRCMNPLVCRRMYHYSFRLLLGTGGTGWGKKKTTRPPFILHRLSQHNAPAISYIKSTSSPSPPSSLSHTSVLPPSSKLSQAPSSPAPDVYCPLTSFLQFDGHSSLLSPLNRLTNPGLLSILRRLPPNHDALTSHDPRADPRLQTYCWIRCP